MNRILYFLLFIIYFPVSSQTFRNERKIQWVINNSVSEDTARSDFSTISDNDVRLILKLPVTDIQQIPIYFELLPAGSFHPDVQIELRDPVFEELTDIPPSLFAGNELIGSEITPEHHRSFSRGIPYNELSFLPLRKNPVTGKIEKLTAFTYGFVNSEASVRPGSEPVRPDIAQLKSQYSENSVLTSGTWVKIKTTKNGIYRISYNELVMMGIEDPANVRIFGNGNRMLPKMNDQPRPVGLIENKIFLDKGQDGIFNQGDYILFYGQGPVAWDYNDDSGMFEHDPHLYSDGSYYFVSSSTAGKGRIGEKPAPDGPPGIILDYFDDYIFHESDLGNLLKSGREWFGEHFKMLTSRVFSFSFPGIVTGSQIALKWRAAARSTVQTSFMVSSNSVVLDNLVFAPVNFGSVISDYASLRQGATTFYETGEDIELTLNFNQNTPSSEGWLDYILLNVKRSLEMYESQIHFRNLESFSHGGISEFRISRSGPGTRVWDISDHAGISEIRTDISGNTLTFRDNANQLNQYIAFDGAEYMVPEIIGRIPNQNLLGIRKADLIIITHPLFMPQANQLAGYRENNDGLDVVVVTPEQVYNEFSSGKPDITAIRDFIKMLYDRASSEPEMPRYLLLFGKGSYDNRPGNPSGTNFIPTYQSVNSIRPTQSFVSDDFYGLLDDDEGEFSGLIDIGIGRFPVSTPVQAQALVNKIIGYDKPDTRGDWQNLLCFIGDDGDNNIHMRDADLLSEGVKVNYPVYNIDKIYLDAWPKTGTSLGQRYPAVNDAINERVRKGALIINYTGHGNELRLADENILDINDVVSWSNQDRLPVFMTATCEFSRFDNPERISAGEMLLLNPNGGGIALFSTTRLVYATPNFFLNQNFYRYVLEKRENNREMRLGDVMRLTKISTGSGINKRNFTLLGDPSSMLAIPEYNVTITSVNESPVNAVPDTLKALSRVKIEGVITDNDGYQADNFNGLVYLTVYDKKNNLTTLGNDGSSPFSYTSRSNIIYKGKASVSEGEYSFSFIVPKDIGYHYGSGRISSWAKGGISDAAGFFENIIIGGSDPDAAKDTEGPEIALYMNDRNFVSGGITNQDPLLLASLTDSSGINTVGSGIGHDITLTVNNDPSSLIVLNDYYVADADSYQSGIIEYPFSDLKPGNYSITLKAWDVYNNSSESSLDFTVTGSEDLAISNVFNYPNPFTSHTAFHFEHNRPGTGMSVLIQIFTVSGRLVKTIESPVLTSGFKPEPIHWDGLDNYGDRIGRGVYIYRIRLRTGDGQMAEKYEKLVILK